MEPATMQRVRPLAWFTALVLVAASFWVFYLGGQKAVPPKRPPDARPALSRTLYGLLTADFSARAARLALWHRRATGDLENAVYRTEVRDDLKARYGHMRLQLRFLAAQAAQLSAYSASWTLSRSQPVPAGELAPLLDLAETLGLGQMDEKLQSRLGEGFVLLDPPMMPTRRAVAFLPPATRHQWQRRLMAAHAHFSQGRRHEGNLALLGFIFGVQSQMNQMERQFYDKLQQGRFLEAKKLVRETGPLPQTSQAFMVPALEVLASVNVLDWRGVGRDARRLLLPVSHRARKREGKPAGAKQSGNEELKK